ncbi:MAG: VWA domain-containing protein, partial [Trichococcus flocculiformis]
MGSYHWEQGISGTNGSAGINDAINVLETSTADHKCIVLLTDGEDTEVSYAYDDLVATASEKKINIYSVGLNSADATILRSLADGTGGEYYFADSSLDFDEIFGDIENEVIDREKDSNDDGISDFETKLLCENTISYATGAKNCFVGLSYDDINNDTDGDYDNDG